MEFSGQHHASATLSRERTPEPTEEEAERSPQTNWTFQRKTFLAPTGIRTQDRSSRSPVTIMNATPTSHMDNTILKWIFREHGGRMQTGLNLWSVRKLIGCCELWDKLSLFCTMTKNCTIISQIITILHVSTLSCHPRGAWNQYLAKLHKYFKCSCW
jgi:hypothetical protein